MEIRNRGEIVFFLPKQFSSLLFDSVWKITTVGRGLLIKKDQNCNYTEAL